MEKIGRYSMSAGQELTLGTPVELHIVNSLRGGVKEFMPKQLIFNTPCYGFALLRAIEAKKVPIIIDRETDAFMFSHTAVPFSFTAPMLTCKDEIVVKGEYTGLAPAPFTKGYKYLLCATFAGPATLSEEMKWT
jgi:hypothetical protein